MSPQQYGYAVFGKVADEASMKVVDKIAEVEVENVGNFQNVPVEPVVIEKAVVVGEEKVTEEKEEEGEEPAKAEKELKKEPKKMEEEGE